MNVFSDHDILSGTHVFTPAYDYNILESYLEQVYWADYTHVSYSRSKGEWVMRSNHIEGTSYHEQHLMKLLNEASQALIIIRRLNNLA